MLIALLLALAGSDEFVITETVHTKPVLTMITADGDWCVYCNKAAKDLAEAKDLPFVVKTTTTRPAWVTVLPVFVFNTPNGDMKIEGYSNLSALVNRYKFAIQKPVTSQIPQAPVQVPVVTRQLYYVPAPTRRFRLFR